MPAVAAAPAPRDWDDLDANMQTALLIGFGRHQDGLPPTCDPAAKADRFTRWLAARGVRWSADAGRARS